MSRKITLSILIFLAVVLGIWFLFGTRGDSLPQETPGPADSPFGTAPEGTSNDLPINTGVNSATQSNFQGEVTAAFGADRSNNEVKLYKLSSMPVAGFVAYTKATSTLVRYVDRGTGHIFDATLPSGKEALVTTRVTNNTISPVYEAIFRKDAGALLIRLLSNAGEPENLLLTLSAPINNASSTLLTASTVSLQGGIESPAAGTGNTLYYSATDIGAISSASFQGTGVQNVWQNGLNHWRIEPLGSNLLVFTKPSAEVPGYAYRLSGSTPSKILGPLYGLIARGNSAGNRVLYSYNDGSRLRLLVKNLTTQKDQVIEPATLADKCAWSSNTPEIFFCGTPIKNLTGTEPDDWYKGNVSSSDYLWELNTTSEISDLIVEPQAEFGISFDIFKPALSPNDQYFIFINKLDLSLWAIKLN